MNPLSVCLYMCSYEAGSALCCPLDAVRRSRSDLRISEGSDLYREPEVHMCCESRSDPPTMHHCTLLAVFEFAYYNTNFYECLEENHCLDVALEVISVAV